MTLIPLKSNTIGNEVKQTVNARELHEFLEVGRDFSNWIKGRIDQFSFVENQDFICSPVLASETRGGQNRIEYHLTLDMAKELSMVERNEKGKQARQYFIACEKQAKALVAIDTTDPIIASLQTITFVRQQQLEQERRLALLEAKVTTRDESYFTVAGYCNLKGIKLDRAGMSMVGKMAASYCRDNGWKIGEIYDSRYGKVNEYPTEALQHAVSAN